MTDPPWKCFHGLVDTPSLVLWSSSADFEGHGVLGCRLSNLVVTEDVGVTPKDRMINEDPWAPGLIFPPPQAVSCPHLSFLLPRQHFPASSQ